MASTVIETRGLRKEFRTRRGRHVVAVDALDLAVPRGGVHGFLGPNGSGKTTTIRMLLGLSRATRGQMALFGETVPDRLPQVLQRVGAVVENPKFTPTFTGRRNLQLLARTAGVSSRQVDAAIERVGLRGREHERFGGYSLGMKQRLAIAATLLRDPELLILDEPTNGLDPAGIRDIRDMIRDLGNDGVTVLISSHILAEVQQVCDSVSIIGRGRLLASGRVADLLAGSAASVRVGVTDPARAAEVLAAAGFGVRREGEGLLVELATPTDDPARITRLLAGHEMWVHELSRQTADLESFFLDLTHGTGPGADPREDA
ncbi:ABC transporter ATP-binding protein [Nocardioides massiliensis]|uniref:ABC-2 type transport system ATP-binding protein n=1 Tax=Nocardioides massiliensis TaxID=1325935 RepID=A0ABT9NT63_9ACTN|nr:ABC transporter ATP-binding protein [Nocardioides massiliensis]MDP9823613.1 ABC-2 type transport system ATP-binding protein [Nocardioides massiliensis]